MTWHAALFARMFGSSAADANRRRIALRALSAALRPSAAPFV
jgi:hypothetical protein